MRSEYSIRSEFSANKALYETYKAVEAVANTFNKKGVSSIRPEAKLSDMQSMKEWQVKNKAFGKATYALD